MARHSGTHICRVGQRTLSLTELCSLTHTHQSSSSYGSTLSNLHPEHAAEERHGAGTLHARTAAWATRSLQLHARLPVLRDRRRRAAREARAPHATLSQLRTGQPDGGEQLRMHTLLCQRRRRINAQRPAQRCAAGRCILSRCRV
eukprot:362460-Chlamydomonas_euryale.AAC.2